MRPSCPLTGGRAFKVTVRRVDDAKERPAPLTPCCVMSLDLAFDSILAAAQVGAGWARGRLYESVAPAVQGYVRAQGVAEPADVIRDVFVAVLTGLPTFVGDEQQFRSWVFTIAYRRVVHEWRARARRDT